jgi:type IV fimbrial biogenesis protein FimT
MPGERGISLIEILIGLAVLGILTTMAVPAYMNWINNTYIRNAAEAVQLGLQVARVEALKRNARVEFRLQNDSGWTVGCVPPGTANCPQNIETRLGAEGVRNVALTITPAGATTLTFSALGQVVANADASASITQVDVDSTVLAAANSRELRVPISLAGMARTCDPNVAGSDPRHC